MSNSVQSMTGFAQKNVQVRLPVTINTLADSNHESITNPSVQLNLSIRSVNNRFLDLNIKVPEEWRGLEVAIRDRVQSVCKRGKVEVRIQIENIDQPVTSVIDDAQLTNLLAIQSKLLAKHPHLTPLSVNEVLRWPQVMINQTIDLQPLETQVLAEFDAVLAAFVQSRVREGDKIKHVLLDVCQQMLRITHTLRPQVPDLIEQYQQKLTTQLQEALKQSGTLDTEEWHTRMRQEVLLYGMRIDIMEELERITAHLEEVSTCLQSGGVLGKKLDFMIQELHRESNTVGSKSGSKTIADQAIALKLLIEQMREQIQNIE